MCDKQWSGRHAAADRQCRNTRDAAVPIHCRRSSLLIARHHPPPVAMPRHPPPPLRPARLVPPRHPRTSDLYFLQAPAVPRARPCAQPTEGSAMPLRITVARCGMPHRPPSPAPFPITKSVACCGMPDGLLASLHLARRIPPAEHLLGPGTTADMLHDACPCPTLDWPYAHDPTALFAGARRERRGASVA